MLQGVEEHDVIQSKAFLLLRNELDRKEQCIFGLKDDAHEDVNSKMIALADRIVVEVLKNEDISVAHRIGRTGDGKPKPSVCKFISRETKFEIFEKKEKT